MPRAKKEPARTTVGRCTWMILGSEGLQRGLSQREALERYNAHVSRGEPVTLLRCFDGGPTVLARQFPGGDSVCPP